MVEVIGKGGISAKIITDSIANGIRLTTMELNYHRFIHSEFMTHRMFSRNASSSRAIPVEKMIKQVNNNPAMPIHWGKNQPGMQARDEVTGSDLENAIGNWKDMAYHSARYSGVMSQDQGVHKQVVNRLLEPFQFIKVIVTATEWDNFFNLRLHPDADPHINELARCMKEAMDNSEPVELQAGQYHLPYFGYLSHNDGNSLHLATAIKRSVARCARVSYMNHDSSAPSIEKDIALHDLLLSSGHMSPFEHVATPMEFTKYDVLEGSIEFPTGATHMSEIIDGIGNFWSGNFRGWVQYRSLL